MLSTTIRRLLGTVASAAALLVATAAAQEAPRPIPRDSLLAAARGIMQAAHYAALITLDSTGHPQARAIDPFAPDDDFTVWIGTNRRTRKVGEIARDPRVTLYYFDGLAGAYVTIRGRARVVTDSAEAARRWKPEWEAFYPDRAAYVLIAVTPVRLEVVSERLGIVGDPVTWVPPAVPFR